MPVRFLAIPLVIAAACSSEGARSGDGEGPSFDAQVAADVRSYPADASGAVDAAPADPDAAQEVSIDASPPPTSDCPAGLPGAQLCGFDACDDCCPYFTGGPTVCNAECSALGMVCSHALLPEITDSCEPQDVLASCSAKLSGIICVCLDVD